MAFRDPKLKKNFWGSMPTQRLIYPNYMYYNMNAYNDYGLIQLANFTITTHILCKIIAASFCLLFQQKQVINYQLLFNYQRRSREFLLKEQSSLKTSLLILFDNKESVKFPKHYFLLLEILPLADDVTALAPCFTLIKHAFSTNQCALQLDFIVIVN